MKHIIYFCFFRRQYFAKASNCMRALRYVATIVFIFLPTAAYSEECFPYNREYAIAKELINNQPQKNNLNRSEFISFIRSHHQPISKKYLIKKLLRCSTQQVKQFFHKYDWTEKNTLHFKELYASEEFVKLVKTFDGYEDAIYKLYDNHKKFPRVRNFFKQVGIFSKEKPKHHQRIIKLYQEIKHNKELYKEQKIFDEWNGDLIYALNNSYNFDDVASVIGDISDRVSTIADSYNYCVNYEVEIAIEKAIKKLHITNDINEFVFYTAITQHLLSDLHEQSFQHAAQTTSTFVRSTELFIRGLTTFVKNLNPVTQITNLAHTGYFLVSGVCHLAHFVSDITLGSLYLSSESYDARLEQIANAYDTITSISLKDTYNFISNVPAEQWVDLVAHFAADFIFFGGVHRAAAHLRKIDAIGKTKKSLAIFAKRIRHTIDNKLANNPVLVTAEGITIQCKDVAKNVGGATKKVITCSRELLIAFGNKVTIQIRKKIPKLRKLFDNKRKGFAEFSNKSIKLDYEHVLGMNLTFSRRGVPQIGGFHLDHMKNLQKSGLFKFNNIKTHKSGFYSADKIFNNNFVKNNSFFPPNWTHEEVAEAIFEAYDNADKLNAVIKKGKYILEGFTKQGIKIEMAITKNGKITTAYPRL